MPEVIDRNRKIVCKSRNLAGIRRYVSSNTIKQLDIKPIADGKGELRIWFDNEATFYTEFQSFTVLRDWVRRWRNVYGAPLSVAGQQRGNVDSKNKALDALKMTVTDYERAQWPRVAAGARARGNELLAVQFESAIAQPELNLQQFDFLADIYRNWLVFNELP